MSRTVVGLQAQIDVLRVFERIGAATSTQVADVLPYTYQHVNTCVQTLFRKKQLVRAGFGERRSNMGKRPQRWGLPGCAEAQDGADEEAGRMVMRAAARLGARRSRSRGSGQIAGPRVIGRGLAGWGGWRAL